jgi:phosphate transport system protein
MNEHSSKQFDLELDAIRANLTRMGGFVEEQFRSALNAFTTGDAEQVDLIVARDHKVDEMEIAIDDACAHIVARRQPTAIDLRMVMAVGKTVTDLERIGDEAKKIAKVTRNILERGKTQNLARQIDVASVGLQAAAMLHDVLDAFVRLDTETAGRIVRQDKDIDSSFRAIMRQLVTYMMEDPRTISTALDVIFIAKSIERIGDHAKNIAKDVIYIARGRDVRHLELDALEQEIREA